MSNSSIPIDAAWTVLKDDPDKVEKILPLIPLAFGAYGAYTGAGGRFKDDEGNWGLNFGGNAKMVDPITGGYLGEKELGTSWKDRAVGATVGATQAINPFSYVRGAGALARGTGVAAGKGGARALGNRLAARGAKADTARRRAGALEAAGDVKPVGAFKGVEGFKSPFPGVPDVATITPAMHHQAALRNAATLGRKIGPGAQSQLGSRMTAWGKTPTSFRPAAPMSNLAGFAGRATQLGGPGLGALAAWGVQDAANDLTVDPTTSGFGDYGGQSGAAGFGQGNMGGAGGGFGTDTGIGGVGNRSSTGDQMYDIWQGKENTQQFGGGISGGGGPIATGENMRIGDRMLKEAQDMMYKVVCPKCGKKNCNCKEYQNKADKKPAHGLVIVIGSKAGPGPSKDGKREKLDSEKKE